jgi:hypothetical protein
VTTLCSQKQTCSLLLDGAPASGLWLSSPLPLLLLLLLPCLLLLLCLLLLQLAAWRCVAAVGCCCTAVAVIGPQVALWYRRCHCVQARPVCGSTTGGAQAAALIWVSQQN